MSANIYLVFGRQVDIFDTLDEALSAVWYRDEWSDDDWWDRIEVLNNPDGVIDTIDRRSATYTEYARQRRIEWDAKRREAPSPPHVANLTVDGEILQSYYGDEGEAQAEAERDRLRPFFGDRDRLHVQLMRRTVRR